MEGQKSNQTKRERLLELGVFYRNPMSKCLEKEDDELSGKETPTETESISTSQKYRKRNRKKIFDGVMKPQHEITPYL